MLVTNQTSNAYWFGPLHLPAGIGQTLTVDDTSATSLYLTSDVVADALNNLFNTGKIAVSDAAEPFPRPTGVPQLVHGDGSPEGSVVAPQGSAYLRRDIDDASDALYVKTTGATIPTGWEPLAGGAVSSGTSFPGAPSDGDEYVYVADVAGGVFWRFRYYATGGFWAFAGGPPLYALVSAHDATTSTAWGDLSTAGPSVAVPFAGDYDLAIGCGMSIQTASAEIGWMTNSVSIAAGAGTDDAVEATTTGGTGAYDDYLSVSRVVRLTGVPAGTLTAKYACANGHQVNFANRWIAVTPVKH